MRPSRFAHLPRKVRKFLREHPEYAEDMEAVRDPETGETIGWQPAQPEVDPSTDRRTGSYSGWTLGGDEANLDVGDALDAAGARFPWGAPEDDGSGPGYSLEQRLAAVRVGRVLNLMAKDRADLLRRRYLEGATLEELAAHYGVVYQVVQRRVKRAKQEFMRVMGERFAEVWPVEPKEL